VDILAFKLAGLAILFLVGKATVPRLLICGALQHGIQFICSLFYVSDTFPMA